jgi:hypothetical protein
MFRRLWPAGCLVGALLLAAVTVHATEDVLTPDAAPLKHVTKSPRDDGNMPALHGRMSNPAVPTGDDDTPNRTGNPRGTLGGNGQPKPEIVEGRGGRFWDFITGYSQRWIRWVGLIRSF